MKLAYKPDFEEAARRWDAFWAGEIIDRPCLRIVVPKEGREPAPGPGQLAGVELGYRAAAEMYDRHAASRAYLAEAIPFFRPGFGPDQVAGFFGAELRTSPDSRETSWAVRFVERWEEVFPLRVDEDNPLWQGLLEYFRIARAVSEGKFLLGQLDLHTNMDLLSAIRGAERLCLDLIERPDAIEEAMRQVRPFFGAIYDAVYEAGGMQRGTIGWLPFYSCKKFATIQCDFICMISPDMARRFVIPALAEEAAHLDHCAYHLDGPGALPHLEDICAIREIHVIQWVPGAGRGEHIHWIPLLKEIQSRGKGLIVNGTPDQVKLIHRELRPERVLYEVHRVHSEREGYELIEWFRRNT